MTWIGTFYVVSFPHFHAFQPSQDMFCSFGFNSVPAKYLSVKTIPVWAKKGACDAGTEWSL